MPFLVYAFYSNIEKVKAILGKEPVLSDYNLDLFHPYGEQTGHAASFPRHGGATAEKASSNDVDFANLIIAKTA